MRLARPRRRCRPSSSPRFPVLGQREQRHGVPGVKAAASAVAGAAAWARSTAGANTPMRAMTPLSSSSPRLNAARSSGARPSRREISATAFGAPLLPTHRHDREVAQLPRVRGGRTCASVPPGPPPKSARRERRRRMRLGRALNSGARVCGATPSRARNAASRSVAGRRSLRRSASRARQRGAARRAWTSPCTSKRRRAFASSRTPANSNVLNLPSGHEPTLTCISCRRPRSRGAPHFHAAHAGLTRRIVTDCRRERARHVAADPLASRL